MHMRQNCPPISVTSSRDSNPGSNLLTLVSGALHCEFDLTRYLILFLRNYFLNRLCITEKFMIIDCNLTNLSSDTKSSLHVLLPRALAPKRPPPSPPWMLEKTLQAISKPLVSSLAASESATRGSTANSRRTQSDDPGRGGSLLSLEMNRGLEINFFHNVYGVNID